MTETLHDYVVRELQNHKGTWPRIAEASDVPLRSIEKIARREVANPGILNIERLAAYFRNRTPGR